MSLQPGEARDDFRDIPRKNAERVDKGEGKKKNGLKRCSSLRGETHTDARKTGKEKTSSIGRKGSS